MKIKMGNILLTFLMLIFLGDNEAFAEKESDYKIVESVHVVKNLKLDDNTNLKHLDLLETSLFILNDKLGDYYFCLNEEKNYPLNLDYNFYNKQIVDPKAYIIAENFYSDLSGKSSSIKSYKNETIETKYAATQIAMWAITNPEYYDGEQEKILKDNAIINDLLVLTEAGSVDSDNFYTLEDAIKDANEISISFSDLEYVETNNNKNRYQSIFNIEGVNDHFQINEGIEKVSVYIIDENNERKDITNQCNTQVDYKDNKVLIDVPKNIVESNNEITLHMTATIYIESKEEYYTVYGPDDSKYQDLLTKNNVSRSARGDGSLIIEGLDLTEVSGSKVWLDDNNAANDRPAVIKLFLYANGEKVQELEVTGDMESDVWEYIFSDLPVFDANGEEIEYQVLEETVPNYQSDRKGSDIMNSYNPGKTDMTVTKVWNDENNNDGLRPKSVEVVLLANDQEVEPKIILNKENNWNYTWTDLNEIDSDGNKINYSVKETNIPPGYMVSVDTSVDGHAVVTNTHTLDKININGEKRWEDDDNDAGIRPDSVKIDLLADGVYVEKDVVVSAENNWKYSFTGLPRFKNGKKIEYVISEQTLSPYTVRREGDNLINTYNPEKTNMTVIKKWDDGNDIDQLRPDSITVELLTDGKSTKQTAVLNNKNDWTHTWTDLIEEKKGKKIVYSVAEIDVPSGYESSIQSTNETTVTITNTHTPKPKEEEKIKISGEKKWEDNNNQDGLRPESIAINLLANGNIIQENVVVDAASDWKYSFADLPKHEQGKEIVYTIVEHEVPNYTSEVDGYNIINKYTPSKTQLTATKVWEDNDNQDGLRPKNIEIELLANGESINKKAKLTVENNWTYTWTDLDEKANGQEIIYSVKEINVADGYEVSIDEIEKGNVVITNVHIPEMIEISGEKQWEDNNNQDGLRPESIAINLLANGKLIQENIVVDAANDWKYSFTDLPKYEQGKEIVYTIVEHEVPNYTSEVNGYNLINRYTPGKTKVTAIKVWEDNNDQDGIRPKNIEVELLANGKSINKKEKLTAENNWTYTWTDLDEHADGQEIIYSVKEINVADGYEVSIDDSEKGNVIITNTHIPEVIEISGEKQWEDNNNQDGLRPESIAINVLANGKLIQENIVVDATSDWKYVFTDLPKYEQGKEIVYTVVEHDVPNYTSEVNGYNIINRYTPGKTQIIATKVWEDNDDQDGLRPKNIEIELLANGESINKKAKLTAENNWTHTWTDLDEKANGQEIIYSVKEINVANGYEVTVDNRVSGNVIITNTHIPEMTEINGEKQWEDSDNQDGIRPESIAINLLANGKLVQENVVVDAASDWKYSFTDLPKYDQGKEIVYTVVEHNVSNYSSEVNGYNIINRYTPGKTQMTATKVWEDNNNQDGMRPKNIEVELLANGKSINKKEKLTAENNWTYTWTDLDEQADGKEIAYTVKEINVANGYEVSIDDSTKGNVVITNTHVPEVIEINGEKQWEDSDNQDGIRPESIEINLLADGKLVQENVVVNAASDWKYSFTDLPKYEQGKEITYTVSENNVLDYSTSIKGYDIFNKYTPGKTTATVTKYWDDHKYLKNNRPKNIKVQLYADGTEVGKPVKLNDKNNWTYTWQELSINNDGENIVYTVKELDIPDGYEVTIADNEIGNMIITNTLKIKECEEPDNYPKDQGCSDENGEECDSDNSDDDHNNNVNGNNGNNGNSNNGNDDNCYVFDVLPATGESSSVIYIVMGILIMFSICGVFFNSLATLKK